MRQNRLQRLTTVMTTVSYVMHAVLRRRAVESSFRALTEIMAMGKLVYTSALWSILSSAVCFLVISLFCRVAVWPYQSPVYNKLYDAVTLRLL